MHRSTNGRTLFQRASKAFEETKVAAKAKATEAKTFIQKRPFVMTLLGMGAGFVLGLLMRARTPKVELVVRQKGRAL